MTTSHKLLTLLIIILTTSLSCFTQSSVFNRGSNFSSPVDIPLYLSGTFGELRSNHFHSGIDIKTQGVEGKKIRSIDTGWVSRINVSTSGYGKAIYITHPNGYVSVYGHLKRFNDTIQSVVVAKQYEKESYTLRLFFDKGELPVSKGELIAYSGNTGGSHGPHLHFEIRDEKSQNPVNPLMFNSIGVKDFYRPKITRLLIYPTDNQSLINGKNDTLEVKLSGWGEGHVPEDKSEITISGRVSFGIGTYDLMNKISNKNGVYSTKLFHDTTLLFNLEMNRLSFSTTRYINSLIDYHYYKKNKSRVIRTQVDTNNMLNNYLTVINNGIIDIQDTLQHTMVFEVRDAYKNLSKLTFKIKGSPNSESEIAVSKPDGNQRHFNYFEKNTISGKGMTVSFPANSFYRSTYFDFEIFDKDSSAHSNTYKLHSYLTPVHKYFNIRMDYDSVEGISKDQYYISYSTDNIDYYYTSTKSKNNKLEGRSRSLGYYRIMSDTIPPIIKEVNFKNGLDISNQKNLKIKIIDNETGISSYKGYLNDKWILMEYDPKKDLLRYDYDEHLLLGTNVFKLEITDLVGNQTIYNIKVNYKNKSN